eukprot:augustus_masked-scaffold_8-processed-gene-1.6-mRNA-1 protein AED:1.00 eAED:1.00 QI:0/-1/0/0/-1/1/1/0/394
MGTELDLNENPNDLNSTHDQSTVDTDTHLAETPKPDQNDIQPTLASSSALNEPQTAPDSKDNQQLYKMDQTGQEQEQSQLPPEKLKPDPQIEHMRKMVMNSHTEPSRSTLKPPALTNQLVEPTDSFDFPRKRTTPGLEDPFPKLHKVPRLSADSSQDVLRSISEVVQSSGTFVGRGNKEQSGADDGDFAGLGKLQRLPSILKASAEERARSWHQWTKHEEVVLVGCVFDILFDRGALTAQKGTDMWDEVKQNYERACIGFGFAEEKSGYLREAPKETFAGQSEGFGPGTEVDTSLNGPVDMHPFGQATPVGGPSGGLMGPGVENEPEGGPPQTPSGKKKIVKCSVDSRGFRTAKALKRHYKTMKERISKKREGAVSFKEYYLAFEQLKEKHGLV